jgi:hypothetical protein
LADPWGIAFFRVQDSGVYVFLIYELMAQPALGHAVAVGLFAGLAALGGIAIGGAVQRRWSSMGADVAAMTGDHRLALGALVAAGLGSALGWGYLWNLPMTTLARVVLYILGGLLFCRPTRWHLDEALMAGLLAGFVTPVIAVGYRFLETGVI